jgi:ankyrin repeat protein
LMHAAYNDDHAIVEKLVVARADVNTKNNSGCALPLGPSGGGVGWRRRWLPTAPIAPAPSGRNTALHIAAYYGCTNAAVRLLVGGADQTITNMQG